jgi:hypothetical protein
MRELAEHDIEFSLTEWQFLGIALAPLNIHFISTSARAAFSRARSSNSGVRSIAFTCAPKRAAVIATTPVPQPTSSTRMPGVTPANPTSRAAAGLVNASSGAKFFQPSFCNCLIWANPSMRFPLRELALMIFDERNPWCDSSFVSRKVVP